jgi:O-antigen/teichoic acid export membrane protein
MKFSHQLFTNIVWRGLYLGTNFIINIYLAQLFGAGDNGVLNMFINNAALLILVTGVSLEAGLNYFGAAKIISQHILLRICLAWSVMAAVISALIVPVMDGGLHTFFTGHYLYYFLVFSYLAGYFLINNLVAMFYAEQDYKLPNVIMITGNILFLLFLTGVLLFAADVNKIWVLKLYLLLFFVQGICLAVVYYKKLPAGASFFFQWTLVATLLQYIALAAVNNLIFFLVYRIDYWFVEKYCTADELGNYIQASKLGQMFLIFPTIIASTVFSRVASASHEKIDNHIPVLSRMVLLVNVAGILFIALTGYWLFPWLYGKSFGLIYPVFLLLAPGILSLSVSRLTSAYFGGSSALRVNFKGNLIALVLITAGDVWLIPRFGIWVAAIISSVGYMCFAAYSLYQFCKTTRMPVAGFFIAKMSDIRYLRQLLQINKPGTAA